MAWRGLGGAAGLGSFDFELGSLAGGLLHLEIGLQLLDVAVDRSECLPDFPWSFHIGRVARTMLEVKRRSGGN